MTTTISVGAIERGSEWRNWGRSVTVTPQFIARPTSVEEVVSALRFAKDRGLTVKPIGAGHSFTAIGATAGVQLDLGGLDGLLAVEGNLATFAAGTHLYQIASLLAPYNLALANMGDIDRQTISGAVSTGTHGTGSAFGGLATQIRALTLVTAAGEVLRINKTENSELLPAAALGLGALGVVVDITIECVPAFLLHAVERPENVDLVLNEWHERIAAVDHFEFYVWPHTETALTKSNTRLGADEPRHPLGAFSAWLDDSFMSNTVFRGIVNLGRAVPALISPINRLAVKLTGDREFTDASASVFASDRTVRFREMEYALPVAAVPDAVRAVRALIDAKGWRISFPIEVRSSAADELWLSTATGRATGYVAAHRYYREDPTVYFREVEAIMRAHDGRPHWGKMHNRTVEDLRPSYLRLDDFVAVRNRLDPDRLFANDYLTTVLGA